MFHTATIELPTTKKQEMIDVTKRVRAIVAASNVQSGLCSIFCGHTTGAITVNENTDPDVQTDILNALERAVPRNEKYYKHEEGNAHAHAKAAVLGFSETIPVQGGKLALGTWQAIYFCEFDGPRNRKLVVTVLHALGLSIRYGPKVLLDEASFTLGQHDRVGLIGPNGSGKSTLMKIVAGSVEPDGGSLQLVRRAR